MYNEELLLEIIKLLHKNDDTMLRNNLRKEIGFDYVDFLKYISILEELGYIEISQIKYNKFIYLTDKGKKIAKQHFYKTT